MHATDSARCNHRSEIDDATDDIGGYLWTILMLFKSPKCNLNGLLADSLSRLPDVLSKFMPSKNQSKMDGALTLFTIYISFNAAALA